MAQRFEDSLSRHTVRAYSGATLVPVNSLTDQLLTARFVVADLLTLPNHQIPGPFDLLFDGGTLDDFPPRVRPQVAAIITQLARPRSLFVMWCFYAHRGELPSLSLSGPSRFGAPPIEPGEETRLFGEHWDIEPISGR